MEAAEASIEAGEVEGRKHVAEAYDVESLACHVDCAIVPLLLFKKVLFKHRRYFFLDSVS